MTSIDHRRDTGPVAHGEPHLPRGPFSRWPLVADGLLVVGAFATSLAFVALSRIPDGADPSLDQIDELPAGAYVLLAVAAGLLWWRRRRPVEVTAGVLVVMIVWAVAGYGDGNDPALVVAAYGVGRYVHDRRLSVATMVGAVGVDVVATLIDAHQRVDIVPAVLVAALPWYVGRRVRNRGEYLALVTERAERLEAEQHARARRAVADERARIARELHDVVAHQVSMMTVQAGAAKTIAHVDVEAAVEAMGDVERAGRQALGELRHLLGVLRPEAGPDDRLDHAGDLGPQPRLADIAQLTDRLARTGATVELSLAELPRGCTAAFELSAYRIVQESLTNVVKHAGPAPEVVVAVSVDGAALSIEIANTVSPDDAASSPLPASGFGVAGMRERANLLGGTLSAGFEPTSEGSARRYRVSARLPFERESS